MSQRRNVSRREVLAGGAVLATAGVAAAIDPPKIEAPKVAPPQTGKREFVLYAEVAAIEDPRKRCLWNGAGDRQWLGPDYWAAPLQDWGVFEKAAECLNAAPNRVVHLLTSDLADRAGKFDTSVTLSRPDEKKFADGKGSAGFRLGIRGPLGDYRNALLYGKAGLEAGVTSDGTLFVGNVREAKIPADVLKSLDRLELRLSAEPEKNSKQYTVRLTASNCCQAGESLEWVVESSVAAEQLVGNVALVANFGGPEAGGAKKKPAAKKPADGGANAGAGLWRFADWTISGDKFESHPDRAFGPILFTQYTLSGGTLKLTAQMPPLGARDSGKVRLVAGPHRVEADIHPEARAATFRIDDWDASADVPYVVEYDFEGATHKYEGTIRREPTDKPVLTVADVSCNIHSAFPNDRYVEHMKKVDPDFIAFVGDQFYESTAGYGVTTAPLDAAFLDYLRKWYCHGWTWRELTRDRPSISLPDDHDVYQGNLWGESGAAQTTTQEAGGYRMPTAWVNVVHNTQTSHHPDPHAESPTDTGVTQYYGRLVYGGLDFALLADRQYKIGPEGVVPPTGSRADHVIDPNFDPRTADLPDLPLLGDEQEKFLAAWADDQLAAAPVKVVVSQTIFTAMATTHGGPNGRLVADYDTNGWPQTARNRAVRLIRKACAIHLAGDQHLPAVVQYGVDAPRDGSFAFAGPAVNVGYPRWWEPTKSGENPPQQSPAGVDVALLGDFRDSFGNHMCVVAVKNGAKQPRSGNVLEMMADKASGLGLARFDKAKRTVTLECWPFDVDPTAAGAEQFAGWPVVVELPKPNA